MIVPVWRKAADVKRTPNDAVGKSSAHKSLCNLGIYELQQKKEAIDRAIADFERLEALAAADSWQRTWGRTEESLCE